MSSVHSCEAAQSAKRVSGGAPFSGSARQAELAAAGHRAGDPARDGAVGRLDALGSQQLGDELAKDDVLAVGDEVGLASAALASAEDKALDDVVDVGDRGPVGAAVDPSKRPRLRRLGDLRQQRRVAGAPDEPRPDDQRLDPVAVGLAHQGVGLCLGPRVGGGGVGAQRQRLVAVFDRHAGENRGLGPAVDEAGHPAAARGLERVARSVDVAAEEVLLGPPVGDVRGEVEGDVAPLGTGGHRRRVLEVAPDGLGAELRDRGRGVVGPRQRPHRDALADQAADQPAADEPGPTGDESGLKALWHPPGGYPAGEGILLD